MLLTVKSGIFKLRSRPQASQRLVPLAMGISRFPSLVLVAVNTATLPPGGHHEEEHFALVSASVLLTHIQREGWHAHTVHLSQVCVASNWVTTDIWQPCFFFFFFFKHPFSRGIPPLHTWMKIQGKPRSVFGERDVRLTWFWDWVRLMPVNHPDWIPLILNIIYINTQGRLKQGHDLVACTH